MSWETQLIYASIESTRPLLMVWWVWKWCGSCAKGIAVTRSLPKMNTNTDWHAAQSSSSSSSSLLSPAFKQLRESVVFFPSICLCKWQATFCTCRRRKNRKSLLLFGVCGGEHMLPLSPTRFLGKPWNMLYCFYSMKTYQTFCLLFWLVCV